jgi:glycosyltransferase involved in cell wall biosynthesis
VHVLIGLTYYRPHYSGLTIYAERLARGLAERGHRVTVLTSRYHDNLPSRERVDGVDVIRLPVLMRVSKGVIMPSMPYWAWKITQQADVVNFHLPQLDAAPNSLIGRLTGKPVVLTYHCDLRLPTGLVHALANQVSTLANHFSASMASVIVTNTRDYAQNSAFLRRYLSKARIIQPPVALSPVSASDQDAFRRKYDIQPNQRIIGMAARLATEKGVEYLIKAMPSVLRVHPSARVLFVGQHEDVLGEEAYARRLRPYIDELGDHWSFLGILPPVEFASFLHEADVTVLPSINSTESFGLVQVESMICGTPVVASNLPGVRKPVQSSGMGEIVPAQNPQALARAISVVLDRPGEYRGDPAEIARKFSPQAVALAYEKLFQELIEAGRVRKIVGERVDGVK